LSKANGFGCPYPADSSSRAAPMAATPLLETPRVSRRCTIPTSASHPTVHLQPPRPNQSNRQSKVLFALSIALRHVPGATDTCYQALTSSRRPKGGAVSKTKVEGTYRDLLRTQLLLWANPRRLGKNAESATVSLPKEKCSIVADRGVFFLTLRKALSSVIAPN
jgi:hypothetical protein